MKNVDATGPAYHKPPCNKVKRRAPHVTAFLFLLILPLIVIAVVSIAFVIIITITIIVINIIIRRVATKALGWHGGGTCRRQLDKSEDEQARV